MPKVNCRHLISITISQFLIAKRGFKHKIVYMGERNGLFIGTRSILNKRNFFIYKFECTIVFVLHKSLPNSSKTDR